MIQDNYYDGDAEDTPNPTRRSVSLNCRVEPELRDRVREAAEWADVSPSDWLREVVEAALAEYERLRFGNESEEPTAPVEIAPVELSIDYERRVREGAAEVRSTMGDKLVAPIRPTEKSKDRSSFRFPDPKDCPHLPTDRRAGGRCSACGGNIGRYLQAGRVR